MHTRRALLNRHTALRPKCSASLPHLGAVFQPSEDARSGAAGKIQQLAVGCAGRLHQRERVLQGCARKEAVNDGAQAAIHDIWPHINLCWLAVCWVETTQLHARTSTNAASGSGSAVAVPLLKLVALAEVRLSSGGVVSVPVPGASVLLPSAPTQITVTLYLTPGDRPFTWHLRVGHAPVMQVGPEVGQTPAFEQGHSRSSNDAHCRLPGGTKSTMPLVPFTASVELMTELQSEGTHRARHIPL